MLPALTITDGVHLFEDQTFSAAGVQVVLVSGGAVTLRRCSVVGGKDRGLEVNGGTVFLEDCSFIGNRAALWAAGGAVVNLTRCRVEGPGSMGLLYKQGASGLVVDCSVSGYEEAAVVVSSAGAPRFERCVLSSRGSALFVQRGGRGALSDSTLRGDSYGVFVDATSAPVLSDCRIEGAVSMGLDVHGGGRFERCQLHGNNVGIYLMPGADPHIIDCDVHGGLTSGLVAIPGAFGRVEGCRFGPHPAGAVVVMAGADTIVR